MERQFLLSSRSELSPNQLLTPSISIIKKDEDAVTMHSLELSIFSKNRNTLDVLYVTVPETQ